MICIRIELWPFGDESRAKELGRMYIANDGQGTPERGNYKVAVCRKGTTAVPTEIFKNPPEGLPKAQRVGNVKDYPRLTYNVWRLISRAIRSAFPEEK